MSVTQPQTTNSTRAVQGALYNQLATTLSTPAASQQSRKQHHACAVVCPRCIAVASYSVVAFLSDPAICRAGGSLLLCETCMLPQVQRCCCCSAIFVGSRVWPRVQSSVHYIFYFCKYHPASVVLCSVCHACVTQACVTRGVISNLLFVGSPRFCAGEAFFRYERHNKDTWYLVRTIDKIPSIPGMIQCSAQ